MTNAEFFKEEIRELQKEKFHFGLKNGKPVPCIGTDCRTCDFEGIEWCVAKLPKWLVSEHLEEVTIKASELADDTKVFVNDSDDFYHTRRRHFAKNLDNKLFAYEDGTTSWTSIGRITCWKYMWLEDGTRVVKG